MASKDDSLTKRVPYYPALFKDQAMTAKPLKKHAS